MSEFTPAEPNLNSYTFGPEITERRISAIHNIVDTNVTPVQFDLFSKSKAESFGLDADKYEIYEFSRKMFGHGLYKFVPKDSGSDTIIGIKYANIGGDYNDPTRSLHDCTLLPSGEISEHVSAENTQGLREFSFSHAPSDDSKENEEYESRIRHIYTKVDKIVREPQIDEVDKRVGKKRAIARGRIALSKFINPDR